MDSEAHLLSLKVLRLTKPTFATSHPIYCEPSDLLGNVLATSLKEEDCEQLPVGQFLLLPQCPVNIYLGETFSSYVCVYSETDQNVFNITLKIDLQTTMHRLNLATKPVIQELIPSQTIDTVIHHEVKEIGTHILVCEVAYTTTTNESKTFRKFYKIQVLKPLDVKTKFQYAENDEIYLEAQVQNITNGPICLEKVALDASYIFDVSTLSVPEVKTGNSGMENGKIVFLQPQAICQFLYCLKQSEKAQHMDMNALKEVKNIGKLDIIWRSSFGEKGRLQTSQLQRTERQYGDLHLTVIEAPSFVVLEDLFHFKCKLMNNCDNGIDLTLKLEVCSGLTWCGISGRKLDTLPAHSSVIMDFKAIPVIPGLITISGIKLIDPIQKKTYSFDNVGQVFVLKQQPSN